MAHEPNRPDLAGLRALQQSGKPLDALASLEALRNTESWTPAHSALSALCLGMTGELARSADELASIADSSDLLSRNTKSDQALALFLNRRTPEAREILAPLAEEPDAPAVVFSRFATVLLALGETDEAARAFEQAVEREPGRAEFHSNLGSLYLGQQRYEKALEHFDHALRIKPELMPATKGKTACLLGLEKLDETLALLEQDAEADADNPVRILALARMQALADKLKDAEATYRRVIEIEPDNLHHMLELAEVFERQDRRAAILHLLPETAEVEDDHLAGLVASMKAHAFLDMEFHDKAQELLEQAEQRAGKTITVRMLQAELAVARGEYERALRLLDEALEIAPGSAPLLSRKANTLMWIGETEKAADIFEQAARINPMSLSSLVSANRLPESPEAIESMKKIAENPLVVSEGRAAMSFALARMHDKHGEYEEAFRHLDKANELARRTITFDPDAFSHLVDNLIAIYTPELLSLLRPLGVEHRRPVFVVGMPRSGTTLMEQMLASHPEVFGAGELSHMPAIQLRLPQVLGKKIPYPTCMRLFSRRAAQHAAAYYLEHLRKLDGQAPRVVDKLPHNFVRIGLIASIFPTATIIHMRRDIRDVALSNYFQNFKAKGTGLGYAFNLKHLGQHMGDYLRLMEHWRTVLPGRFMEVDYESLVEAPEEVLRPVVENMGLEWNESVLSHSREKRPVRTASVWQARQPVYTSSKARWKRYERQLKPFLDALPKFGPSLPAPM